MPARTPAGRDCGPPGERSGHPGSDGQLTRSGGAKCGCPQPLGPSWSPLRVRGVDERAGPAGYLLLAGLVAVLVYEMVGLRVLRKAWVNVNLVWAAVLILTGLLTPLL